MANRKGRESLEVIRDHEPVEWHVEGPQNEKAYGEIVAAQ